MRYGIDSQSNQVVAVDEAGLAWRPAPAQRLRQEAVQTPGRTAERSNIAPSASGPLCCNERRNKMRNSTLLLTDPFTVEAKTITTVQTVNYMDGNIIGVDTKDL